MLTFATPVAAKGVPVMVSIDGKTFYGNFVTGYQLTNCVPPVSGLVLGSLSELCCNGTEDDEGRVLQL